MNKQIVKLIWAKLNKEAKFSKFFVSLTGILLPVTVWNFFLEFSRHSYFRQSVSGKTWLRWRFLKVPHFSIIKSWFFSMQHVLTEEILRLGAHSIFIYENTMTLLAQAHLKALKFEPLSSLLAYTGCH